MKNFGVGPMIYLANMYDKINSFNDDLPFYLELSKSQRGEVLELCCGTGRLTLPLAKSGIDITGLDYTDSMLESAREKFNKNNLKDIFVKGDMRSFGLNKKFKLIFIPFNSIQSTYKLEDLLAIFENIKNHLDKDGVFAFDIFNPNLKLLVGPKDELNEICRFKLETGSEVILKQTAEYDKKNQIVCCKWHFFIDGKEEIEKLDMRCFYPQEMDNMLKMNGFEVISKFGDFQKSDFHSESEKQIYICKVAR